MTEYDKLKKFIADRTRQLRKEQKLSQEVLSERAGLGLKYINQIENQNYNLSIQTLAKIISALGISFEDYFASQEAEMEKPHLHTLLTSIENLSDEKKNQVVTLITELIKQID